MRGTIANIRIPRIAKEKEKDDNSAKYPIPSGVIPTPQKMLTVTTKDITKLLRWCGKQNETAVRAAGRKHAEEIACRNTNTGVRRAP